MTEANTPAPEAYVLSLLAEGRFAPAFAVIEDLGGGEIYAPEISNHGHQALASGRMEQAEELFLKALALRPELAAARRGLGLLYIRRGKLPSAVTALREATRQEPESAVGQALLGLALCNSGLVFEAIPCLLRALSLDPGMTLARATLDKIHGALGENLSAEMHGQIEALLANRPDDLPGQQVRPRLSVCMIVKDEERNLPRCLGSIKKAADEIVVVDTGSRDDTVEIARKLGAKLGYFEWCDDFAAARNHALSLATGDWVLIMDADDEMAPGGDEALRTLLDHPQAVDVFALATRIACANGLESFIAHPRLFRNHLGLHYTNGVHEQLVYADGQPALPQMNTGISVYHHGYLAGESDMEARRERNLRILAAELSRHPERATTHFFLGKEYRMQQNFAQAAPCFQHALLLCPENSHSLTRLKIFAYLGEALSGVGRGEEAVATYQRGLKDYPENAELLFGLGEAQRLLGKEDEAAACYQAALEGNFGNKLANQDFTCRDLKPRLRLAEFALAKGDWEEAQRHWEPAHFIRGDVPALQQLRARIELARTAREKPRELASRIEANRSRLQAHPEDGEARRDLVEALLDSGEISQAEHSAAAGAEFAPHKASAQALLGEVYLAAGRRREAEERFAAALTLDPKNPAAHIGLGNLALQAEAWHTAEENFEAAVGLAPQAIFAWLGLGRSYLEQRAIEPALKCYQTAAQLSNGSPEVMQELAKAKKRLLAMVQPVGAKA
jgi:tetratricopeptide (TPR) repeat protein